MPTPNFDQKLMDIWGQDPIDSGQPPGTQVDPRTDALQKIREQNAAEVFEMGSFLLLSDGNRLLERAKTEQGTEQQETLEQAKQRFHDAIALNFYLWPAYDGLGAVKRVQGDGLIAYFQLSFKGMKRAFDLSNTWFTLDILFWMLGILQQSIVYLLIGFALLVCGKYARQNFLSTASGFEDAHFQKLFAHLAAITVLLCPFLLGLNLFLCAGLSIALFLPFFDARERTAGIVLLLSPLLLPVMGYFSENIAHARVNSRFASHLTHYVVGDPSQRLAFLGQNVGEGEERHLSALIQGLIYKNQGALREAVTTFESIPNSSVWFSHATMNLGNLHVLAKEYQEALALYKNLEQVDRIPGVDNPKRLAALRDYNISVVKSRQGIPDEAESFRTKASDADPSLDLRIEREGAGQILDAVPDHEVYLSRMIRSGSGQGMPLTASLGEATGVSVLLLVLGLLHVRLRNSRTFAKICDKCGRIFFPSDAIHSEWCSQCITLYVKKDDLPTEAKMRKYDEVARFNRHRRWVLSFFQVVLPGSRKLLTGNALNGVFTLALWVVLILINLHPITSVSHLSVRFLQTPVLLTWLMGTVTAVYWLIFGLRPAMRED